MKSKQGRLNIINREEYEQFVQSPTVEYRVKQRIKSTRFVMRSFDDDYNELKKKKVAIDITNPEVSATNGKRAFDGIFSPYYGADTTQEAPVFSCDCHRLTGGTNRGRICSRCFTEVRTIEADLRTCMYIDIAPYHILTYHGYNAMSKVIKNLNTILNSVKRINKNGYIIDDGKPTIMDLYDDYNELYLEKTGIPRKIAFTSKVPVYSARLRPLMKFGVGLSILGVNKSYLSCVTSQNNLKASPLIKEIRRPIEIQRTLNEIQKSFLEVIDHVLKQCAGKGGIFRKSLASGRIDNSSRMVISLGDELMAHEIDLPYQTIMVIYEEEIANYLSKLEGISISEAISEVDAHQVVASKKFIKIINQFLKSGYGVWGLVNRNPTISESGIMYCKIRKIHEDTSNFTMALAPDGLVLLGADFDGDQLTFAAVKNPIFHSLFMSMCPTYAFIDRATGYFNDGMDFKKDYTALLGVAHDQFKLLNEYMNNPDDITYNKLDDLGIWNTLSSQEEMESRKEQLRNCLENEILKKNK